MLQLLEWSPSARASPLDPLGDFYPPDSITWHTPVKKLSATPGVMLSKLSVLDYCHTFKFACIQFVSDIFTEKLWLVWPQSAAYGSSDQPGWLSEVLTSCWLQSSCQPLYSSSLVNTDHGWLLVGSHPFRVSELMTVWSSYHAWFVLPVNLALAWWWSWCWIR